MLTPSITCDGRVSINGHEAASTVAVRHDADGTLYLWVGAGRSLIFPSFLPKLVTCLQSIEATTEAANLCFESGLGCWKWGPLGHPGDGEFESRPVNSLPVRITADPGKIGVALEGQSEPGQALYRGDDPDPARPGPLAPWQFEVEFVLTHAALQTLCGQEDSHP